MKLFLASCLSVAVFACTGAVTAKTHHNVAAEAGVAPIQVAMRHRGDRRFNRGGHRFNRGGFQRHRNFNRNRGYFRHRDRHRNRGWLWGTAAALGAAAIWSSQANRNALYQCRVWFRGRYRYGNVRHSEPCIVRYRGRNLAFDRYQVMQ